MKNNFLLLLLFCFTNIQAQIITTVAGNDTAGYSGDGGPATAAKMSYIDAIAIDNFENLYISDRDYNVIRKVNAAGIITTFAGNGTFGFSGDNSQATIAQIESPKCLTFDKKGNLYFFDAGNKRIRKIDTYGIITTFAGNGSATASGDLGPATAAGLGTGQGVCIDSVGNIYISAALRIRKVDTFGIITTFAGNGLGGFGGDGGPATAASVATNGQIEMDMNGNMYIADLNCIRKINSEGVINTVAGSDIASYSGDGGPATVAQLNEASGVFPDNCGNFYIADYVNNRIRKVDGHGIITTIAGNGYGASTFSGGYSGDGGAATAAELYHPETIYLDKNSNIYIADEYNYCVRYIQMDGCKDVVETPPVLPKGEEFAIYPNPASDYITLSNPVGINAGRYNIKNILGQIVLDGSLAAGNNDIDVSRLAEGDYIISAYQEGASVYNTMFVKK